jgi:uncharacterized membrane protein (UPF0136 family)
MDPILLLNLILCLIIFVMGVWEYFRTRSRVELYVGTAFGLFAVSHLLTFLGFAAGLTALLIVIRLLAYLIVIYALYIAIAKRNRKPAVDPER